MIFLKKYNLIKSDYIMIYESEIGLIYIEEKIYLKLEYKNILKILFNFKKIKKINFFRKNIILKNIENIKSININYIDYKKLQWIFMLYGEKKLFKKSYEVAIVDVPLKDWENKIKTFEIKKNIFKIYKNNIEIFYKNDCSFLIFIYLNELLQCSKYYNTNLEIKINNDKLVWEEKNIINIIKKLKNSNKCEIISNIDFTFYLEIRLDNSLIIEKWKSQTI